MNITLALSGLQTFGIVILATALAVVLICICVFGPKLNNEHEAFIEQVNEEFPGCRITHDDDLCEVRIISDGQPLIVTKNPDGSLHLKEYEPDAMEALS